MLNQSRFSACARYIVDCLYGRLPNQSETLLADPVVNGKVKIIQIFDYSLPPNIVNALINEDRGLLEPLPDRISNVLGMHYNVHADVVYAVSLSDINLMPTPIGIPMKDDTSRGYGLYHLDGATYRHYQYSIEPGAIGLNAKEPEITPNTMVALHEFAHALGSGQNGLIVDLYNDNVAHGMCINKKHSTARGIRPQEFAVLDGSQYQSASSRGQNLPYESNGVKWLSYHCEQHQPAYPAIMDLYYAAPGGRYERCEHDKITRQFLIDRLSAKVSR
jgi:hypothetical protein